MDKDTVAKWLNNYVEAWKSYDRRAIGDLFSEDAEYIYHPWDQPIHGREAIVASWLESPDAPGSFDAHYEPIAIEGDTAVAAGRSRYFKAGTTDIEHEYNNVFIMHFDKDGRCASFRELFMETPKNKV